MGRGAPDIPQELSFEARELIAGVFLRGINNYEDVVDVTSLVTRLLLLGEISPEQATAASKFIEYLMVQVTVLETNRNAQSASALPAIRVLEMNRERSQIAAREAAEDRVARESLRTFDKPDQTRRPRPRITPQDVEAVTASKEEP